MNARPLLAIVALAIRKVGLEVVLIGNAAAAIQGAPVTTMDFDFLYRNTPTNFKKIKELAKTLGATVVQPYYAVADMYRITNSELGLQIDVLAHAHGIRSFESIRSRATTVPVVEDASVMVASLADVLKSKRAANRPKDLAVIHTLESTLDEILKEEAGSKSGTRRPRS